MNNEETPESENPYGGKEPVGESTDRRETDDQTSENAKWWALMANIDFHVRSNNCHLKPRFNLIDLSLEMSIPQYLLSRTINKATGVSFSAWMNRVRIEHFLDLVCKKGLKGYSLYVHGIRSGFQSKASFINAFKKEMGETPGTYVKKMLTKNGDVEGGRS